jgi:hypothetical protein
MVLETAPESVKSKLPQKRTFAGQFRQKSTGKLVNTFSNGDQEYTDKIVGPGSKEFPR